MAAVKVGGGTGGGMEVQYLWGTLEMRGLCGVLYTIPCTFELSWRGL